MNQLLQVANPDPTFASYFRHRMLDKKVLVTNLVGQYLILDPTDFRSFVEGTVDPASQLYSDLKARNFIRAEIDMTDLIARRTRRQTFLGAGPNLHIMVVTLRCNETCVYCHASRADMSETDKDMSPETAEKVVDMILQTTSPAVTIEFQGGEPLVNFPVVKHIVEYALKKNEEIGKALEFTMVSNLAMMDEEKLAFILEHKIQVCTSIDGPVELHNKQRILPGGGAFEKTVEWIEKINKAYIDMGLDSDVYHVEALLTSTKNTLTRPRDVVDTFIGLGCKALFLRPVDPFGFASKTGDRISYGHEDFLEYYCQAVDYMIDLNRKGTEILERYAAIFLTKILTGDEPNFLDIRSPCGAGIGQMTYDYEGRIFTCDEGRMVHQMGDDFFQIGHVRHSTYQETMNHDTVRAISLASNLEANPGCVNCAYNPYCGVCPVVNYATQGSLNGQVKTSRWCGIHKGIQDYLFKKLEADDGELMDIFDKWVRVRDRDHYIHEDDAPEA